MLLNTHQLEPYQGHGYHLPHDIKEKPSGLGAFPAVFSFPGVSFSFVTNEKYHTASMDKNQEYKIILLLYYDTCGLLTKCEVNMAIWKCSYQLCSWASSLLGYRKNGKAWKRGWIEIQHECACFTSQDQPVDHWPNIVSILLDKVNELNSMEKIVYFFDNVSMLWQVLPRFQLFLSASF